MLTEEELARIVALPSTLGRYLGPKVIGRPYKVYPWVAFLERKVVTTLAQPGPRILVINTPPQEGKSLYMGLWMPLWYLGHNPFKRMLFIAYSEGYAKEWSGRVRDAMKWYGADLFGHTVSPESDAANRWFMQNGVGGMLAAGITGGYTGVTGDVIDIDDVIKTAEESRNPLTLAKHLEEFDGPITDRLQEDSKIFITATRWAENDLSGEVIARSLDPEYEGGIPVEHVNFKAIAEPDPEQLEQMSDDEIAEWRDFMGREYGEGLKGQHSIQFFERMRRNNPEEFMTKRQGTPVTLRDGMFPVDRWGEYDPDDPPHVVARVRVWDLASSEDKRADFTVGTLMGRTADDHFLILDRVRGRWSPDGVQRIIKETADKDGNTVPILIEQSRSGDGAHVIAAFEKLLVGFNVDGVTPKGDKTTRAMGYSAEQRKGRVLLPKGCSWRKEWVAEHVQMDGKGRLPKHDDQIDTAAYCFNYLNSNGASEMWDSSQLATAHLNPELTEDQRLHVLAVQAAMGLAVTG
jgi:predicted phage terminase large subunit-like protein